MLILKIPEQEYFNNNTGEFTNCRACTLKLEHSLVSISKWESKWKKPFLTMEEKTPAEFIDYIRCMTINQDVPEEAYALLERLKNTSWIPLLQLPYTIGVKEGEEKEKPRLPS